MTQININRVNGVVTFDTVFIDVTETVFFTNLDPGLAVDPTGSGTHWPWLTDKNQPLTDNQLRPAPSPNSSQCPVPPPATGQTAVNYGCKFHPDEKGTIHVFPVLAAVNAALKPATKGQAIDPPQQVVTGGMKQYVVTDQVFQVTQPNNTVIQGSGSIGPGLTLIQQADSKGVWGLWVSGAPTQSGVYNFTFTVTDKMGGNLQQTQYSMTVA